jgi:ferritin
MIAKLNYAYYHEVTNSIVYDTVASYLNILGFDNLSDFWDDWGLEEKKHSKWVKEFLQELNIPLMKGNLEEFEYDLNKSGIEFVNVTMQREDMTTQLYHDILDTALELDDSALLVQFANKMLIEQQEETSKALTMQDKMSNIGENKALMQLFDNSFEFGN